METFSNTNNSNNKSSIKKKVQSFGAFLSGMVMPNIAAFIAWGLITALFIKTGWIPNEKMAKMVDPMVKYMLPLLIGYQGGKLVYDTRGGVVGAIATMGVVIGAPIPMFIGAMIMGPLGGYLIKKIDKLIQDKIPTGFEMLINNFSAGILAAILAGLAFTFIGPVVATISTGIGDVALHITNKGLLPLIAVILEPAKVLFLNNAINQGIFSPLGIEQVQKLGKSIFFLLEPNPGPGFGILLAYWLYGKGTSKESAPGAIIIQFFGGIHEIYFPYILMKPILIIAAICGGLCGDLVFVLFHAGLVAVPSPGSIFSLMAMSPKGGQPAVLLGVAAAAAASFLVASIILKSSSKETVSDDFDKAQSKVNDIKQESKCSLKSNSNSTVKAKSDINSIVFACDAGMGSSAMGESLLKKQLKDAGIEGIKVEHYSVDSIPKETDIVFVQENLSERARNSAPDAEIITVKNFLDRARYQEFIQRLKNDSDDNSNNIVNEESDINFVVFACDAGMGSSAMGESLLKKQLKDVGIEGIKVEHYSVDSIPKDTDVVFVQENLSERARNSAPDAEIITVKNFLDRARYQEFINRLKK
ncbi:PTS mannitol transporter subunit IICBA [Clostridium tyrobutyricum]|uniref:PTS mannitol-specific transporter subunit IIBC n=1 Tax=Clostridium tyrobutyricum TaxID=1519 RepID=UPI001C3865CC|nr:PTS mannitol-specific transporter subunit IIBC [Clostridium tyrobutyricum]MBV4417853.1 PTS mannitol transporter subunit IICBA [Clostridium tyrobutyricum]